MNDKEIISHKKHQKQLFVKGILFYTNPKIKVKQSIEAECILKEHNSIYIFN
jgi:hypothetical protein